MATKKVKKFGRGGDILTGLGAGLAGYGIYKALTKGKDQDDDYTRRVKEYGTKGRFPEEKTEEKAAPKKDEPVAEVKEDVAKDAERNAARARALAASKGRPDMGSATFGDGTTSGGGTTTSDGGTTPGIFSGNRRYTSSGGSSNDAGSKAAPKASAYTTSSVIDAGIAAGNKKAATATATDKKPLPDSKEAKERARKKFLESQAGMKRTGITTPGTAKAGDKSGSTQKGRSENPIQGTIDNAGKSMARTPEQKMGERAREVQRRREEEMKSRYKKGGAVKKYASGGSVSSASKRADGIAMRGKTRGKVC